MDTRTGNIYPSVEDAIKAGVSLGDLVTGEPKALRRLSRMIKRGNRESLKRRRKVQRSARRKNRVK